MYDSRSDHPRGWRTRAGKSKHGSSHPARVEARYYGDHPDDRAVADLTTPKREALADHAYDGTSPYEDVLGLKCMESWWRGYNPRHDLGEFEDADRSEFMAEWEIALLDGPEGSRWTTSSKEDRACTLTDLYGDEEPYEEEGETYIDVEDQAHWLAGDPHDFFQSVGDGWLIEGPSMTRPEPLRAGHYVRVYELAREVGVESKHMVRHLRLTGEYVNTHASYVALPVVERVKAEADAIVAEYGARKVKPDPYAATNASLARLRVLLAEEARNARAKTRRPIVRPGAPRPGNSDFTLAHARSN